MTAVLHGPADWRSWCPELASDSYGDCWSQNDKRAGGQLAVRSQVGEMMQWVQVGVAGGAQLQRAKEVSRTRCPPDVANS